MGIRASRREMLGPESHRPDPTIPPRRGAHGSSCASRSTAVYAEADVPAYWLVDLVTGEIAALRLTEGGVYEPYGQGATLTLDWPLPVSSTSPNSPAGPARRTAPGRSALGSSAEPMCGQQGKKGLSVKCRVSTEIYGESSAT